MTIKRSQFRNNDKAIAIGNAFWQKTFDYGLSNIVVERTPDNYLVTPDGHKFLNFSCCSYLDLDSHPKIIEGAIEALKRYGVLDHCISRVRIQLAALPELNESLSSLFNTKVVNAPSAHAATSAVLPLIASGHLSGGVKPVMVFDKHCHFSMHLYKPVCADETEVLTAPHNDMNYLEDCCKKYDKVAYVCDGTYSMGGVTPVKDLIALQEKHGLFVYYDDSHSISIKGKHGEGFIRSSMPELTENTIIVGTLNKAFGTNGAAIMFGPKGKDLELLLERFGGPLAWSQNLCTAAVGASLASAEIHRSPELQARQERLQEHIKLFDSIVSSEQQGNSFPIKLVHFDNEKVMDVGKYLYEQGFYVSPVFFPIVAKDKAGLRVMLRSEVPKEKIIQLAEIIKKAQIQ